MQRFYICQEKISGDVDKVRIITVKVTTNPQEFIPIADCNPNFLTKCLCFSAIKNPKCVDFFDVLISKFDNAKINKLNEVRKVEFFVIRKQLIHVFNEFLEFAFNVYIKFEFGLCSAEVCKFLD